MPSHAKKQRKNLWSKTKLLGRSLPKNFGLVKTFVWDKPTKRRNVSFETSSGVVEWLSIAAITSRCLDC